MRILHAAADMFADRGFEKVTMREIARAVDIQAASIYNHFKSKNDILEYILRDYEQHNSGYDNDPASKLRENPTLEGVMSCFQLVFPKGEAEYYLKVLCVILQEQHSNTIVRERMSENILNSERYVIKVFEILKDLRVIKQDANPDFWAKTCSCMFYAFASRMLLGIGDSAPGFSGMGMAELMRATFEKMFEEVKA